jgi:hypothetical protein
MSERVKTVVKRSEWLRGEGSVASMLFREKDSKRCCLGFRMNNAGYQDSEINGVKAPFQLIPTSSEANKRPHNVPEWMGKTALSASGDCVDAMTINDARWAERSADNTANELIWEKGGINKPTWEMTQEEFEAAREQALKVVFSAIGEDIEFVD